MTKILDVCCGSRMCWFDKNNTEATFMDIRKEECMLCDGRKLVVCPDVIADFRDMPFPDNSFYLVLFAPPHLNKLGKNSWLAKKYGRLFPTWEDDIKRGFDECMRAIMEQETLHLVLKSKWYDMIASGEKTEEYREIKRYWYNRLIAGYFNGAVVPKVFDRICFHRGYTSETISFEHKGTYIGRGKYEWGATGRKVFIIKLGERIN